MTTVVVGQMIVLGLHADDLLAIAGVILVWVGLRSLRGRRGRRRSRDAE